MDAAMMKKHTQPTCYKNYSQCWDPHISLH